MERINGRNKAVSFARLFSNNQFFISDDKGTEWSINNVHCCNALQLDNVVEELAIAGDGSWVVIYGNYYVSSEGVAEQLTNKLSKFFSDQCRRVNNRNREIREARQEAREAAKHAEAERVAREIKEHEERELIQQEEREKEHARGR